MTRSNTIDLTQLQQLREHHAQQLRRIDDAIALMKDVQRQAQRAEKTMGSVRERAAEARKAKARAHYHKTKSTKRRQALLANSKTPRPIDHMRAAFASAKGHVLSRETLQELLLAHMPTSSGPSNMPPAGRANRVLGLALAQLVKGREVKATSNGFMATRSLFVPPSVNGASAE